MSDQEKRESWPNRASMELLRHLAIRSPLAAHGAMPAGQRSRQLGLSMEMADSRSYVQGDDPRHLDWRMLAKFDQLVVRLFYAERALRIAISLDCSASMDFGSPRKFDFARLLTACLGIIAINGHHELRVLPTGIGDDGRVSASSAVAMEGLLQKLRSLHPRGEMDWSGQLRAAGHRCDVLILISDCLPPRDSGATFKAVASRGTRLVVLHTLSPEELHPSFTGTPVLRDPESGRVRRVSGAAEVYQTRLAQWRDDLKRAVGQCGGNYIKVCTTDEIKSVLTVALREVLNRKQTAPDSKEK